ncbi:MAG TPA: response regulator transcription factor, partial [Blastocatellia bacterium]|nr:response regulator transcription factor [Blastocatellia bacterium]
VVAEAADGQQALDCLRRLQPQLALLDIDMPLMSGLRVAVQARDEGLTAGIVFLTVHREESFLERALETGAQGYILKDATTAEIAAGIQLVAAGQPYVSPALTASLLQRRTTGEHSGGLGSLTPTERVVIKLIAECRTTKQIAEQLFISPRTVEKHRTNICQKLGLQGNHALTKYALAHQSDL